jgi:hypothetical protein
VLWAKTADTGSWKTTTSIAETRGLQMEKAESMYVRNRKKDFGMIEILILNYEFS